MENRDIYSFISLDLSIARYGEISNQSVATTIYNKLKNVDTINIREVVNLISTYIDRDVKEEAAKNE